MSTITILALLLGAMLLFLIFAYIRSDKPAAAVVTPEEEFLVRIEQAQSLLEEEQRRRAAAEAERNELAAALNLLRAQQVNLVDKAEYEEAIAEQSRLRDELAAAQTAIEAKVIALQEKEGELAILAAEKLSWQQAAIAAEQNELTDTIIEPDVLHERDELKNELEETNSKLQDAMALTGQFPIQALEINRLNSKLAVVTAERDDLKAKVTEAAVYIRDVQIRYQTVLDKMRQMLVQQKRDATGQTLAPLREEVEQGELDSQTDIAPHDSEVAVPVSNLLSKNEPVDKTELHASETYIEASKKDNGSTPTSSGQPKQVNGQTGTADDPTQSVIVPSVSDNGEALEEPEATAVEASATEIAEPAAETAAGGQTIDLQVIKGIGETYAARLYAAGIRNLPELVVTEPDRLREVTGIKSWHKADPQLWIDQARQLLAAS